MNGGSTIRLGDCFRFKEKTDYHLWIVISDPLKNAQQVLSTSVTTWLPYKDRTCILRVGDHPYIQRDSCVYYAKSRLDPHQHLCSLVARDKIELQAPLETAVLMRIQEGALLSPHTPFGHSSVLIKQMG